MTQTTISQAPNDTPPTGDPKRPRWWKRPWVVPLWTICGIFFVLRVPNYLGFTPENSLFPVRSYSHYLLLSSHIVIGTIALTCCCLQVWPWLRRHHPKAHRISGRIYVGAVIPASALAMVSAVMAQQSPPYRFSSALLAILWLATTLVGFRMARKRRYIEHRRWMIRSFALCFSIVVSRLWTFLWVGALIPFQGTYYGGDLDALIQDVAVGANWSSWVVNLLIAEWWIERTARPRKRRGGRPPPHGRKLSCDRLSPWRSPP